jgi:hypothetical protein
VIDVGGLSTAVDVSLRKILSLVQERFSTGQGERIGKAVTIV